MLEGRAHEIATCTFCPKLCRFACPVAEAECRETVTPWALMTSLDDARRGRGTLDAELLTHCSGCRRCEAVCKHATDVAGTLYEARAIAAHEGLRAWGREAPVEVPGFAALPEVGDVTLVPGFASEALVSAAVRLLRAAGLSPARSRVLHAGARRVEAGLPDSHRDAVRRGLETRDRVVCLDAGDALALREMRLDVSAEHLTEAVAELTGLRPVIEGDVLYLDACRLGRGLGVYEPPRRLLAAVTGGTVRDAVMNRREGGCCGSGAGYATLHPERGAIVAREAAADEPHLPVVTAGVSCVEHLRAALERPVHEWACLVAAGLEG